MADVEPRHHGHRGGGYHGGGGGGRGGGRGGYYNNRKRRFRGLYTLFLLRCIDLSIPRWMQLSMKQGSYALSLSIAHANEYVNRM